MSSLITHIAISEILKQKYKYTDEFILGTVLPDIYKKANYNRDLTHFILRNKKEQLPNIQKFCNEYIYNKDEISQKAYGYLIHLIQDKIWFKYYIPQYAENKNSEETIYLKDNSIHSPKDFSKDIYDDYSYIDNYIINKYNLDIDEIKENIKYYSKDIQINNLVDSNIICRNVNKNRKNVFISIEDIEQYIEKTIFECCIILDEIYKKRKG